MTKRDAENMAQQANLHVKQGERWKAVFDGERKVWCVEGPSIHGGHYRYNDMGDTWYDGK